MSGKSVERKTDPTWVGMERRELLKCSALLGGSLAAATALGRLGRELGDGSAWAAPCR